MCARERMPPMKGWTFYSVSLETFLTFAYETENQERNRTTTTKKMWTISLKQAKQSCIQQTDTIDNKEAKQTNKRKRTDTTRCCAFSDFNSFLQFRHLVLFQSKGGGEENTQRRTRRTNSLLESSDEPIEKRERERKRPVLVLFVKLYLHGLPVAQLLSVSEWCTNCTCIDSKVLLWNGYTVCLHAYSQEKRTHTHTHTHLYQHQTLHHQRTLYGTATHSTAQHSAIHSLYRIIQ